MNTFSGQFKYDPLQADEIRLVKLSPGHFESPIFCSLQHAEQAQSPQYDALSYVWGDPTVTKSIILGPTAFPVTLNLAKALQYLRYTDKSRILWIDALCINQNDKTEKGVQVQNMAMVYRKAVSVVTWIGEDIRLPDSRPEESAKNIFSFLKDIALDAPDNTSSLRAAFHGMQNLDTTNTLFKFLQLPWFKRRWVIQEIAMACTENAQLIYGQETMPWSQFLTAMDHVRSSLGWQDAANEWVSGFLDNALIIRQCVGLRRRWDLDNSGTTLANRVAQLLLLTDGLFLASDARDHIYSMLGIAGGSETAYQNSNLKPNYKTPLVTVLTSFTKYLLQERKRLDIIFAYRNPRFATASWVPTWSHVPWSRPHHLSHFKTKEPSTEAEFRFASDTVLCIIGLRLGEIHVVGRPQKYDDLIYNMEKVHLGLNIGLRLLFRSWEEIVLMSEFVLQKYPDPDALLNAWREVLFHPEDEEQADHDRKYYDHLLGRKNLPFAAFETDLKALGPSASLLQEFILGKANVFAEETSFATSNGSIGLTEGRYRLDIGDQLVLCPGAAVPFILRKIRNGWRLLGPCYLHGCMDINWQKQILEASMVEEFAIA